jgi:two-component system nitrate/nitrite response regulator NarL
LRDGLVRLLEDSNDIEVIATASDGEELLAQVGSDGTDPDVLVLDLRMPGLGGVETARRLRERHPRVRVVILSDDQDPRSVSEAVGAGASAYVATTAEGDEVVEAVRMVARGHVVLSGSAWDAYQGEGDAADVSTGIALSEREREVLVLLARGLSNRQIAEELRLSAETVKTHVVRLYRRLGVSTRTDAVAKALRRGIID